MDRRPEGQLLHVSANSPYRVPSERVNCQETIHQRSCISSGRYPAVGVIVGRTGDRTPSLRGLGPPMSHLGLPEGITANTEYKLQIFWQKQKGVTDSPSPLAISQIGICFACS